MLLGTDERPSRMQINCKSNRRRLSKLCQNSSGPTDKRLDWPSPIRTFISPTISIRGDTVTVLVSVQNVQVCTTYYYFLDVDQKDDERLRRCKSIAAFFFWDGGVKGEGCVHCVVSTQNPRTWSCEHPLMHLMFHVGGCLFEPRGVRHCDYTLSVLETSIIISRS